MIESSVSEVYENEVFCAFGEPFTLFSSSSERYDSLTELFVTFFPPSLPTDSLFWMPPLKDVTLKAFAFNPSLQGDPKLQKCFTEFYDSENQLQRELYMKYNLVSIWFPK